MTEHIDKNIVANQIAEMADEREDNTETTRISKKKRERIRATLATKSKMLLSEMYASIDCADRRTSLENIMALAHDVRELGLQIADEWPHIEEYAPHIGLLWRKLHESEETKKWATVPPMDDAVFDPSFLRELPLRGSEEEGWAGGGVNQVGDDPFRARDSRREKVGAGEGSVGGSRRQQSNRRVYTMRGRLGQGDGSSNTGGKGLRAKGTKADERRHHTDMVPGDNESLRASTIDSKFTEIYGDELLFALQDNGDVDDWEDMDENEDRPGVQGGLRRVSGGKQDTGGRSTDEADGDVGTDQAKSVVPAGGAKGKRKRPEGPSPKKDRKRLRTRTRDIANDDNDDDDDDDDDDDGEGDYPLSKQCCQNCTRKDVLCFTRPRRMCTACHDRKVKCTNTIPKESRARAKAGSKGKTRAHKGPLPRRSGAEPSTMQSRFTTDRQMMTRMSARMPMVTPKGRTIRDGSGITRIDDDDKEDEGDGGQVATAQARVAAETQAVQVGDSIAPFKAQGKAKEKRSETAMDIDAAENGKGDGASGVGEEGESEQTRARVAEEGGGGMQTTTKGRKTRNTKLKGTGVDVTEGAPPADATLSIYRMSGELMGEYTQGKCNQVPNNAAQRSASNYEVHPATASDADITVLRRAIMQLQADTKDQFIRREEFDERASTIRNMFMTELTSAKEKEFEMVKQHEKATLAKVDTRVKKSTQMLEQELEEALKKVEETKKWLEVERASISAMARNQACKFMEDHLAEAVSDVLTGEVFEEYRVKFDCVEELHTELETLAKSQEESRMKSRQEDLLEIHNIAQKVFREVWAERIEHLVDRTTATSIQSLVGDHLDTMAQSIKRLETELKGLVDDSVTSAISSNLGDITMFIPPPHSIFPLAAVYQNMAGISESQELEVPFGTIAEPHRTASGMRPLMSHSGMPLSKLIPGSLPKTATLKPAKSPVEDSVEVGLKSANKQHAEGGGHAHFADDEAGEGDVGGMEDVLPDEGGDHEDGHNSDRDSQGEGKIAGGPDGEVGEAFPNTMGADDSSANPTKPVNLASASTRPRGRGTRNTMEPRERLPRIAKSKQGTETRGRGRGRGN
ncbi:hypothetical protein BKA70DRAFT_1453380 [Coprinopsis sp. MPI-PUGE-AT-0042]|nr:hypothetical protein BKA70DRAFT_1453380 [Coprinopsis sp. MPI-PUGE-AT-0042]